MMTPREKDSLPDNFLGRFAKKLIELRTKANLSHEEMAKKLDVDPRTIYRWEAAETSPKIVQLPDIAKTLKVTVPELFPKK